MSQQAANPTRLAGHHPCLVRVEGERLERGLITDYGKSGARLIVRGATLLPDEVDIMCLGLGLNTRASIAWRGEDAVGLTWQQAA